MTNGIELGIALAVILLIVVGVMLVITLGDSPEHKRIDDALDRIGRTHPEVPEAVFELTG